MPNTLPAILLLQSGYRSVLNNDKISATLNSPGVTTYILPEPEIENSLIDPETVAKASGASVDSIAMLLPTIYNSLRERSRSSFLTAFVESAPEGHAVDELITAEHKFDSEWEIAENRRRLVRGSEVIEALNIFFEQEGYRIITGYTLARAIRSKTIQSEILDIFLKIEEKALGI